MEGGERGGKGKVRGGGFLTEGGAGESLAEAERREASASIGRTRALRRRQR